MAVAADSDGFGDAAGEVFDFVPVGLGEVADDVFGVGVVLPGPVTRAASASASARMRPSSAEAARRVSLSSLVATAFPLRRRRSSGGYGGGCGLFEFVTLGSGDHAGVQVDLASGVGAQKDLAECEHRKDFCLTRRLSTSFHAVSLAKTVRPRLPAAPGPAPPGPSALCPVERVPFS